MTILSLAEIGKNHSLFKSIHGVTSTFASSFVIINNLAKKEKKNIIGSTVLASAVFIHGSLSTYYGITSFIKHQKIITREKAEEVSFEFFFATNLARDIDVNTSFSELAIKSAIRALFKKDKLCSAKYGKGKYGAG